MLHPNNLSTSYFWTASFLEAYPGTSLLINLNAQCSSKVPGRVSRAPPWAARRGAKHAGRRGICPWTLPVCLDPARMTGPCPCNCGPDWTLPV